MLKLEVFLQMKSLKYKSDIELMYFKPAPETQDDDPNTATFYNSSLYLVCGTVMESIPARRKL